MAGFAGLGLESAAEGKDEFVDDCLVEGLALWRIFNASSRCFQITDSELPKRETDSIGAVSRRHPGRPINLVN